MIIFVFLFPMRSSMMNVGGKALWKNRWKYIEWCFLKKTALLSFSGEEKQPLCVKNSHLVQNKHWNGALFAEAYLHTYFSFPVLCLEFSSVFFHEGNEYSFFAFKAFQSAYLFSICMAETLGEVSGKFDNTFFICRCKMKSIF